MGYLPIEHYGIIGNLRTAALVGTNGSIDWFCFPVFDSPSVFGSILDERIGGRFQISPLVADARQKQFYWPDTNILVTRFLTPDGVGQVTDFMPVGVKAGDPGYDWLMRRVTVSRGSLRFRMECTPAFDYARATHETEVSGSMARFQTRDLTLELSSEVTLSREGAGVACEFTLHEGQGYSFVLRPVPEGGGPQPTVSDGEVEGHFQGTVDYWRRWLGRCTYVGRWREIVHRSALALKLLTYEPTGAIVASPTCSLPEDLGGSRNWDYRYTWIRDAAFTIYAFMSVGFTEEAGHFMRFLSENCPQPSDGAPLQTMYSVTGQPMRHEETLTHLEGYRGSRPVRIGNGAHGQLQLDIYGELMDSVYLYNKYGSPIGYDTWQRLRQLTNWVCDHWQETDESIWEVRGGRRHFVYSKLMCWVALDRALRLAEKRSFPAEREHWITTRDQIYEEIMEKGWSEERQAFVQAYESDSLDASLLIMPLVKFISPTDPRMEKTLAAINRSVAERGLVSDSLVYRYDVARAPDGIPGDEGTFNICTFWLVEALLRSAGRTHPERLREARFVFERMLGYANPLGLYAEETGPTGEALGNFPQAFTHLSLISAAVNLDRALGPGRAG